MGHRERKTNRHGGINGITAAAQDGNTDLGRVRLDRGHHGVAGVDGLAGNEIGGSEAAEQESQINGDEALHR